jgi:hypothetical protein
LSSAAPLPRKAWACGLSRWSSTKPADPKRGKLGPFTSPLCLAAARRIRAPEIGWHLAPLLARREPTHRGVEEGDSPWPSG